MKENPVKLFEQKQVRTHWDEAEGKWYFSIVDVIGILTDSLNPNNYRKMLKHSLAKERLELVQTVTNLKCQLQSG